MNLLSFWLLVTSFIANSNAQYSIFDCLFGNEARHGLNPKNSDFKDQMKKFIQNELDAVDSKETKKLSKAKTKDVFPMAVALKANSKKISIANGKKIDADFVKELQAGVDEKNAKAIAEADLVIAMIIFDDFYSNAEAAQNFDSAEADGGAKYASFVGKEMGLTPEQLAEKVKQHVKDDSSGQETLCILLRESIIAAIVHKSGHKEEEARELYTKAVAGDQDAIQKVKAWSKKILCGQVYYQHDWSTQEQLAAIQKYNTVSKNKAIVLFGDNDQDKLRKNPSKRKHTAGQAAILQMNSGNSDWFDQENGGHVAFGIVTTFYQKGNEVYAENVEEYKEKWLKPEFEKLRKKLNEGYNIIVPFGPDVDQKKDAKQRAKFFDGDKQDIFHNLGTGIANLPKEHLLAIQAFIDGLHTHVGKKKVQVKSYDPLKWVQEEVVPEESETPKASAAQRACPLMVVISLILCLV